MTRGQIVIGWAVWIIGFLLLVAPWGLFYFAALHAKG